MLLSRARNALSGVGMEQRVLLVLTDTVSFPIAFFGAIKIGAVPVPVNTLLTTEDYDGLLRDSRAVALIVSASLYAKVGPVLAQQPFLRHVIVDGDVPDGASRRRKRVPEESDASPRCVADGTVLMGATRNSSTILVG